MKSARLCNYFEKIWNWSPLSFRMSNIFKHTTVLSPNFKFSICFCNLILWLVRFIFHIQFYECCFSNVIFSPKFCWVWKSLHQSLRHKTNITLGTLIMRDVSLPTTYHLGYSHSERVNHSYSWEYSFKRRTIVRGQNLNWS